MAHIILIPEFKRLIAEKDVETLKEFFTDFHPKQSAEFLEELKPEDIWFIIKLLDVDEAGSIFSYFEIEDQMDILKQGDDNSVKILLEAFSSDDRADLFKALDEQTYSRLIALLEKEDKEDVEDLISYEEGTAGAEMSTDYMYCYIDQTVEDLFFYLREYGSSKETIYYIYIVDENDRLQGMITLKDAVLSKPTDLIKDIMSTDLITADVHEDQEVVAKLIEEYDVMAIPIVNEDGVLNGIITYDDVIDIIKEEQTEDVERMMAISGEVEDRDYLDVPVLVHFKKRIPWIIALFFLGIVSSKVIGHYEDVLSQVVILAFFFPLLNGAGGNTGAQSASMVLRSLTLDTLEDSDFIKAFFKEFLISLLVGTILFLIMYVSFYVLGFKDPNFPIWKISLAVSLSMAFQVISATLIGASLPMIASKFKLDPAVVAMPAITTIVDFTGLIIYFNVAKIILGL